jgi:hypothetical protein
MMAGNGQDMIKTLYQKPGYSNSFTFYQWFIFTISGKHLDNGFELRTNNLVMKKPV